VTATPTPTVEAAGGLVLRDTSGPGDAPASTEVLVVHRPAYDDWSLPKGKLDPGEDAATAAVREVAEETGVTARVGPELPSVSYRVKAGPKRVRWFRMEPVTGDPAQRPPDGEVDIARWVAVADARRLLTYGPDRRLLTDALKDRPT
jgi:8-oxo-dGTP diphosphatase